MQYKSAPMSKAPAYSLFDDADEQEKNQSSESDVDITQVPLTQATPEQLREMLRRKIMEQKAQEAVDPEEDQPADMPVNINGGY